MIDWLFRDRTTGRIVIAQFPNTPLWIFLAAELLGLVVHSPIVRGVGLAALAWWALDELIRGVNPWRRALGVGGCVFVVSGVVALVR